MALCPLCNDNRFKLLYNFKEYKILRCKGCRLAITYPFVANNNAYNDEYFNDLISIKDEEIKRHEKILNIIERYKKKGKLLDIGCGLGLFLEIAIKRRWNIEGIDISDFTAKYIKDNLGVNIHNSDLYNVKFKDESFDVINMRHVLEHIKDPNRFLKEIYRILKSDGMISITVPNFNSFHSKTSGKDWFHLSIPYHLIHYTKKSIKRVLGINGFKEIWLSTNDLPSNSFIQGILNIIRRRLNRPYGSTQMDVQKVNPEISLANWLISKERFLNRFLVRMGLGDEIMVIARKI